jgi:predicted XRE-type DNA-binding protein
MKSGEEMITHITEGNIFDDLDFQPEEAESLKLKAGLMSALREWIRREGLSEEEAAHRFDVPIAMIQSLLSGRIDLFSVENLLTMLSNIGLSLSVSIVPKKAA